MHAIPQTEWGQVSIFTWSELTPHQWECFRLALMITETELQTQGVSIASSGTTNEVITELQTQGVKVVQSPIIMQTQAEMVTSIVVSTQDYLTDMIKYLPLYERKSTVFRTVLTADDREFRNTEQQLEIVNRNMFIDTAIEALPIYERDLGIKSIGTLRYDQRREQITSRNRASFDQTTKETIKSVAAAYSNGDVEVNPTKTPGIYEIKFVGTKGIPDNLNGLMQAIEIIVPAHLQFDYAYTFNVWEFASKRTWGDVRNITWDDIRIWNEVS
ncbi:putative phage tail protein [Lysinibacillus sp. Ag94]|uniref:putative phage tail protein n=1 Tax=Lysinibacillus sp. Ag94 TaxID=2936682 RepID=UPI002010910E|nr:putative phage tail protein [Lysinibacillus sp. Ag94]UPW82717.1 YmfQ family protein [Lysinibacillus sp. Ag94]